MIENGMFAQRHQMDCPFFPCSKWYAKFCVGAEWGQRLRAQQHGPTRMGVGVNGGLASRRCNIESNVTFGCNCVVFCACRLLFCISHESPANIKTPYPWEVHTYLLPPIRELYFICGPLAAFWGSRFRLGAKTNTHTTGILGLQWNIIGMAL